MPSTRVYILIISLLIGCSLPAQRQYAAQSVLQSGEWYKLAVKQDGIYKIDVAFLRSLGINDASIPSSSIRLFGNGGAMLPENNATGRIDDLEENAIEVVDGGDGIINGSDYLLFYTQGPNRWLKDSVNKSFYHEKNLYSDQSYYFLNIGSNGRRLTDVVYTTPPNATLSSYDQHLFHEVDTINFLKSGKEWFGEEFSSTPGNVVNRSFNVTMPNLVTSSPVNIKTSVAGRSVSAPSLFNLRVNGEVSAAPIVIPPITGNFLEPFATKAMQQNQFSPFQQDLVLNYSFSPGSFNGQGWLNWFEVFARCRLSMTGISQLSFRDWNTVATGNSIQFAIQNAPPNTNVWEVTDPLHPRRMKLNTSGTDITFTNDGAILREYVAFTNQFLTPVAIGKIENQNLHSSTKTDLIIIAPGFLMGEAQRLADFHIKQGFKVIVSDVQKVYNEFASGSPDPTAIRDYVKMFFDKAGADTSSRPKYLLLFGDASFDFKNRVANNTNFVPAYQSDNSLDPLATYTTDDYFGLLDDFEDINLTSPPGQLDIGIGRIPANTAAQAKNMVDKIIRYNSAATLGAWRNDFSLVADDEDLDLHLQDAEVIANTVSTVNPPFNLNKIYLDAFPQVSGSGGSRYPAVNEAIVNQMNAGNLIWNYSGHGGNKRLADEAILDQDVFNQFNNGNRLPLFITATCDFAPYDDPTISSIGENLLLANEKGAIALTTTTRVVYAYSNRIINNNYINILLQRSHGGYPTLGEAIRKAKNYTFNTFGDVVNTRKFTLLGDPAMKLAIPARDIKINTINGSPATGNDTLKALEKYTITGQVVDGSGNVIDSFNGAVYPTVFDKAQPVSTLGNDPSSPVTTFSHQTNIVHRGKASVNSGLFSFSFIVPKDINYQAGTGRLSLYAENGNDDAAGLFTNFNIGGAGNGLLTDHEGPTIKAFLNDEQFVNGGLVNEAPVLIAKFVDSSGINTSTTGIGHNITLEVDGDDKNQLVLNSFYESDLDNYQKGSVRFKMPALSAGPHTIRIKAWDVANNSSVQELQFVVAKKEALKIDHVLNYPNPFTTKTTFWFEHNQPASSLNVFIQVYSVTGRIVYQLQRLIQTDGNRSADIEWDGRDNYGNKLGRGVYIYKIIVTGSDGKKAEKMEKLYIL